MSRDPRCDPYGWPDPRWHVENCRCEEEPVSVSRDPMDALVEIVVLTMARTNAGGGDIGSGEAFTLGQISGIATRVPGIVERVTERMAEDTSASACPNCGRKRHDHTTPKCYLC
jgi:hypothetical protein